MEVKKQEEIPKGVYKRRRRRGGIDRISELPDSLLHHILSFISIEQVVITSILSTRWRYLWTYLPILNFKLEQFSNSTDPMKFINFVDRFLLGHDMNIQKFNLDINEEVDESCINGWISKVMMHKVQELSLHFDVDYIFAFPPNILNCESLVKLEISGYCILNLPTSTRFSNLKILRLANVTLHNDYTIQEFFSNCQALEEFIIDNCHWGFFMNFKSFSISGPALKRIEIYGDDQDRDDFQFVDCVIKICAPKLVSLKYFCCLPKDFVLSNSSSLIDAYICLETESERRSDAELGYCATNFLGKLSKVKYLDISGETLKILSNAKDLLSQLPTFHNLICLDVSLNLDHLSGRALFDLLQISPNLQHLVFLGELVAADGNCWIFEEVPQCVLLHLKTVSFLKFVGEETDFYVLKFLLNNARVLERMFITSSFPTSEGLKKKLEIASQLLELPRASTNCIIEFD